MRKDKKMTDQDQSYDILREICRVKGCNCPPMNEVLRNEANTPLHMRIWFQIKMI